VKTQQDATVYQNFIIPYFKWSSTCFGPIIRSLKLHKQPLVLHMWKLVGHAVLGRCQVAYTTCNVWQPSGFAYVEGCRTCSCWTLSGSIHYLTTFDNLLVLHTWKVVRHAVVGRQVAYTTWQRLTTFWFCIRGRLSDMQFLDVVR